MDNWQYILDVTQPKAIEKKMLVYLCSGIPVFFGISVFTGLKVLSNNWYKVEFCAQDEYHKNGSEGRHRQHVKVI